MNKKALCILGVSALAANLGYSSMLLTASAQTSDLNQEITCEEFPEFGFTTNFNETFTFDSVASPTLNATSPTFTGQGVNIALKGYSIPESTVCETNHELSIAATRFSDETNDLISASHGGHAILSFAINEIAVGTNVEIGSQTEPGNFPTSLSANNGYATTSPADNEMNSSSNDDTLLIDADGNENVLEIFNFPQGFFATGADANNQIRLIGIDFGIALPAFATPGIYSTTVTWDLIDS